MNIPEKFKAAVNILADIIEQESTRLRELGYETVDPSILKMILLFIDQLNGETLILKFVENSFQENICFWDYVKEHDENKILEGFDSVFKGYELMDKIKPYFTMLDEDGEPVISEKIKNKFFKLLEVMIKLSVRYIHQKRNPYVEEGEEYYQNEFLEYVDIERYQ
jgi:hypothetical protein